MIVINETESARQIKVGAILGYLTIGVNLLAGLIYTPWIIRNLGQDNYGLYTLSVSIISILVMDFGLGAAVTRFLSLYNSKNDQEAINNLLGIIYKLFIFLDFIILLVLAVAYFNIGSIYKELSPAEIEKLKVIFIISSCYSLLSFPFGTLNGILTSYEKFIPLKISELLAKILNMGLIFGALQMGYGLNVLVIVNAVTGGISILLKLVFVKKYTFIKVNFRYKAKKITREIFQFSIWTTVISIAQRFIYNIIPSILGIYSGAVSISVFGASATIEGMVYTFATAINGLFLPKVSRILNEKNREDNLLNLMVKVGRIQLILIGMIFTGFLAVGRDFIGFWLGSGFRNAYICILLLVLPSVIELPQHIAALTVTASGMVKMQSIVYTIMAGINILFSMLLTREYQEIGAAVSVCIAYLFRTAAMNVVYHKKLNINIPVFFRECFGRLCLPLGISLAAAVFIAFLPGGKIMLFLAKGAAMVVIYLGVFWICGLNTFEKGLFLSVCKRGIGK
jgi:O-antigen/teichoic acid export membrane protein